jgi:hypothetical protein
VTGGCKKIVAKNWIFLVCKIVLILSKVRPELHMDQYKNIKSESRIQSGSDLASLSKVGPGPIILNYLSKYLMNYPLFAI